MSRVNLRSLAGFLLFALIAAPALGDGFDARLGRMPVDSRNQAAIAGLGYAHAELEGDRLLIEGKFEGLGGPATVANLHLGLAIGVRGDAIHALTLTQDVAGEVTATLTLSAREIAALRAGQLYIQIHSETAPEGNLWGWLLVE